MHNQFSRTWLRTLERLVYDAPEISPRGHGTREHIGHQFVVPMAQPVLNLHNRRLGYRFMAAEAHWILKGDNRVSTIAPYSRKISSFSDDGTTFFGAYGPKIVSQFLYVIRTLSRDPSSRQAVINIWRENPPKSRDIPCTLSTQFLIRNCRLHQIVTMRSSDIWLGVPYDVFNFSCLAAYLVLMLRSVLVENNFSELKLGYLYHSAGSRHLYDRDIAQAQEVLTDPRVDERLKYPGILNPDQYGAPAELLEHLEGIKDNKIDKLKSSWLDEIVCGAEPSTYELHRRANRG